MTDGDGLGAMEPLIMRPIVRANRWSWSNPRHRRLFMLLGAFTVVSSVVSAITNSKDRPMNTFFAIAMIMGYGGIAIRWLRYGYPTHTVKPPAYMTWTAQRWLIGCAIVGAGATFLIAQYGFAHHPLDQTAVLIVGTGVGTALLQMVRVVAKRRYAG